MKATVVNKKGGIKNKMKDLFNAVGGVSSATDPWILKFFIFVKYLFCRFFSGAEQ